jgi:SWI/SNF-related matrix-associated actin-dependent regulator 1 of chromatin subfamily A
VVKLLPFQAEDVARMPSFGDRVLLAHEMGLGKGIIAYARMVQKQAWPAIVVVPAFLKRNWYREGVSKFGLKPYVLHGQTIYDREGIRKAKVIIVNYEILRYWLPFLLTLPTKLVVIDECQLVSNLNSVNAKCVKTLCNGSEGTSNRRTVPFVFGLSGTPLTNRPWELYSICSLLWPETFDSPFRYGTDYCEASKSFGKWRFSGARNLAGLHKLLLENGMIRRTKEEVLSQLPTMQRIVVPLELENRKEYEEAEADLIGWLAKESPARARNAMRAEAWVRLGYLKRLAAKQKLPSVFAWVDSFLKESDGKLLLGALHRIETPIIPSLYSRYQRCAVQIHGGMTDKARGEAEDRFQNDPSIRILVGQIKACGLGLNLTAAQDVATVELGWNPAVHQQFDKRIDRIGQQGATKAWYLISEDTVESRLCEIIQRKTHISDRVLDGVAERADSLNVFDLLRSALLEKQQCPKSEIARNQR